MGHQQVLGSSFRLGSVRTRPGPLCLSSQEPGERQSHLEPEVSRLHSEVVVGPAVPSHVPHSARGRDAEHPRETQCPGTILLPTAVLVSWSTALLFTF